MTVKNTLNALSIRAKDVWQKEGLIPVLKRGFPLLARCFFQYGTFYVYEHTIKERNEADFLPKIQNFTVQIVYTNQQADELAANGFDFRSYSIHARRNLDKGAIAFCIFVGWELAHVGWVAMTEEAKNTVDPFPFRIDFSNKEACTGGTLTIPKYRRKGLQEYVQFKRFQFLWEKGIVTSRNTVHTNNIPAQRTNEKFHPKIHAKARYLKVLWWQFWKETPPASTSHHN